MLYLHTTFIVFLLAYKITEWRVNCSFCEGLCLFHRNIYKQLYWHVNFVNKKGLCLNCAKMRWYIQFKDYFFLITYQIKRFPFMDNDVVFSFKNSLHIEKQIRFFLLFFFFLFCNIIKTTFKTSLELFREMNLGFAQNRIIYNFEQKWRKNYSECNE